MQSGSATADLLLARARQSVEAKNNRLALDLLTSVVDIAPNFRRGAGAARDDLL